MLHAEGWPLDDLPLASEHRYARCPGVPAFQKAIVPTCVETERPTDNTKQPLLREGIYVRGEIPMAVSGCHRAEEPCAGTVSSDLERAPTGKTGKAGGSAYRNKREGQEVRERISKSQHGCPKAKLPYQRTLSRNCMLEAANMSTS